MTVSTYHLPALTRAPVQERNCERPGARDWAAALAWTAAVTAAHLLLFVAVLLLLTII